MVKKIVNAVLALGGLLGFIGALVSFICAASLTNISSFSKGLSLITTIANMLIMARVGCIIAFVAALVFIGVTVMAKDGGMGGAVATVILGTVAFVGQFMMFSGSEGAAGVGYILVAIICLVITILGVLGVAKKPAYTYGAMNSQNGMMNNQYGSMNQNNPMGPSGSMGPSGQFAQKNDNNNNFMGQ